MGQAGNSNRSASLDDQKERSRDRDGDRSPSREAIKDSVGAQTAKGQTGGAFGDGRPVGTGAASQGGGGGGGGPSPAKDNDLTTGTKKTPTRKRGK